MCAALVVGFLAPGRPGEALGVTRVQQSDGTVQTYRDVRIRLNGTTLRLTSPDRKGVLVISSGACSAGDVERCLPSSVTLRQFGKTHNIAITHGTVFLNLTSAMQHLPHSSQQVPPHGVVIFVHTAHDTYIATHGRLDDIER